MDFLCFQWNLALHIIVEPSSPGPENYKKIRNPNISIDAIIIVTMSKGNRK